MPLSPGARLGPYEIQSAIGAGGMGRVYKARDTHLKRDVALKVLTDELTADPERLARFRREAEILAALNHPHIAQIFGVVDADPAGGSVPGAAGALVLELVDGPTLADRIRRGSVPLNEALPLAAQLADALEYAHERGIVHRDLKPTNIKLTPDGSVKLLDFGLAKALGAPGFEDDEARGDLANSPTVTAPARTRAGVILGTAAYMSPEQARGAALDKRADIWAFGVVLFEMLSAQQCFTGETVTDVLAAVVRTEPDWTLLPDTVPPRLQELLRRCLAKDRKQRLHDIGDARLEIEAAGGFTERTEAGSGAAIPPAAAPAPRHWPRHRALSLAAVALVAGVAFGAGAIWRLRPPPAARAGEAIRLDMPVAPAEELNSGTYNAGFALSNPGGTRTALAWTPDGRTLVFVGRRSGVQHLYLREMDEDGARLLTGTQGAQCPVVSADGLAVAFWSDGAIRKVTLSTGLVEPLVRDIQFPPAGLSWSEAGLLVGPWDFSTLRQASRGSGPIWLLTGEGRFKPVTTLQQGELEHILPHWLPGNGAFLYTARKRRWTWSDDPVFAHALVTGQRKLLVTNAVDPRYVDGRLLFLREKRLYAVAFDAPSLEVRGEPVLMLGDVAQGLANVTSLDTRGAGQFGVSPAGDLAYLDDPGKPWPDSSALVKVDRTGRVTPLPTPPKFFGNAVRIEPRTQSRIANVVHELNERAIWVFDLADGGRFVAKLGVGSEVGANRVWTPDGKRLTFNWLNPRGVWEIVWQPADGSGAPETLAEDGSPGAWTPGGELLGLNGEDIWVLAASGRKAAQRPIVQTPGVIERWPAVSRDGRWLAYGSNELKRFNVYIQPYPGPGRRQTISVDGGECPAWNPAGDELFFLSLPDRAGERRLMAVAVPSGADARPGTPRPLFSFKDSELHFYSDPGTGYDVAPDGRSFYTTQVVAKQRPPLVTSVHIVRNWLEELRAKVPVRN